MCISASFEGVTPYVLAPDEIGKPLVALMKRNVHHTENRELESPLRWVGVWNVLPHHNQLTKN
jgi:hypothetical protein